MKKIAFHKNDKVLLVDTSDIVLIESVDGTYCSIKLKNSDIYTSSRDLKLFEKVLVKTGDFIRINRSIIVNANFIKSYSKSEKCFLELQTGEIFEIPRRKKNEVTAFLRKNHIISL